MKVLLSIKPEFVNKIFDGSKKYEFRRILFKDKSVKKVIIYASAPISKVVGEFDIDSVICNDLNELWSETAKYSGISKEYYFSYFKGKNEGFAIKIKSVKEYKKHLCLKDKFGLTPPQSFAYIRN